MGRWRELGEELGTVLAGRRTTWDTLLAGLLYAALNAPVGWQVAAVAAVALALCLTLWRLVRCEPVGYALLGLALVSLAAALACLSGARRGLFPGGSAFWFADPAGLSGQLDTAPATGGLGQPSFARLALLLALWRPGRGISVAWVLFLTSWPLLLVVLVASYLYGLWRLRRLGGPSVREYQEGVPPPWQGQRRGF
jgi:hypothetical protein